MTATGYYTLTATATTATNHDNNGHSLQQWCET